MSQNNLEITRAAARQIARTFLDGLETECRKSEKLRKDLTTADRAMLALPSVKDCGLTILDGETIEDDFGWLFFWQSRRYLETGNFSDILAGNAPLLVSRKDGTLHETGTAHPAEHYIENFRRCGDPNG